MANVFKWRHFQSIIILQCVRWYLKYGISYRDLEEMMSERGVSVDHTTIYRWVMRYAHELKKRSNWGIFAHQWHSVKPLLLLQKQSNDFLV